MPKRRAARKALQQAMALPLRVADAGTNTELIIGLVGALGTELQKVEDVFRRRLKAFRYECITIRVSDIIPRRNDSELSAAKEADRIRVMMDLGNEAREGAGDAAVLANGIASRIAKVRSKSDAKRLAYIIISLKHPKEVKRLRQIYPRNFYLVGVFASEERRLQYLIEEKRIKRGDAKKLMSRDEGERSPWGQRVSDTFHAADFFVRLQGSDDSIRQSIWRFLDILFADPYKTPTFGEYAMYLAFAASVRSADMSRQVGAVIAKDAEILATGANDCPRAEGGLYWPEQDPDTYEIRDVPEGRDYTIGRSSNKREIRDMIGAIVKNASRVGIDRKLLRPILQESSIKDLTEFGRMVHAEMEAILSCARRGISPKGATLYSTTFPCHNCAKHIIAAGFDRVVFVEPYPKSKAATFHKDAMTVGFDGPSSCPTSGRKLVRFIPFVGVGSRRFYDLFSMKGGIGSEIERSDLHGVRLLWKPEESSLRIKAKLASYKQFESEALSEFPSALRKIRQYWREKTRASSASPLQAQTAHSK